MRIAAFPIWLGCLASTTFAFSSLHPFGQQTTKSHADRSTPSAYHSSSPLFKSSSSLQVASADTISVADMERGVGGRIESAFEAAKTKGEAAFVTFITAGYPNAQGTFRLWHAFSEIFKQIIIYALFCG